MNNKLEVFLEDLTYHTKYEFLEIAKHKKELDAIAEKRGIKLPANDLAIFKGRYAFVDRENKNKCTLPREEAKQALDTLPFKAIDFDHFRRNVVGTWIDAKLDKDELIAYGLFYKGNFPDDYKEIKELMEKDVLAISFEAWGKKDFNSDGSYNLVDIEFAGGALLVKSKPAFDGAEVLEMSKQEKVLEFAKVMTPPKSFIHTGKEKEVDSEKEYSRFFVYDMEVIGRLMSQVPCPGCKEKFMLDMLAIDFEHNHVQAKCMNCEAKMDIELTPASKLTKKGRKIKKVKQAKSSDKGEKTQMKKLLEEYKKESIDEVLQEIAKVSLKRELSAEEITEAKTKVEAKGEAVTKQDAEAIVAECKKVEKKAEPEAKATEDATKAKDAEIAKLKDALKAKDTEVAKLKEDVEKITNEVAEFKVAREKAEKDKKDALIKTRKDELGELAKDMKDEDLLNDDKFTAKKLERENAKLKKALEKADIKVELEVGTETTDNTDPIMEKSERVRDMAFSEE